MPRPNYSRAVREAAEKISPEDVADQPQIVALQKRVDRLEGEHQALVARQRKVRAIRPSMPVRLRSRRASVCSIALGEDTTTSTDIDVTS